jgi:hypothetical protein
MTAASTALTASVLVILNSLFPSETNLQIF